MKPFMGGRATCRVALERSEQRSWASWPRGATSANCCKPLIQLPPELSHTNNTLLATDQCRGREIFWGGEAPAIVTSGWGPRPRPLRSPAIRHPAQAGQAHHRCCRHPSLDLLLKASSGLEVGFVGSHRLPGHTNCEHTGHPHESAHKGTRLKRQQIPIRENLSGQGGATKPECAAEPARPCSRPYGPRIRNCIWPCNRRR